MAVWAAILIAFLSAALAAIGPVLLGVAAFRQARTANQTLEGNGKGNVPTMMEILLRQQEEMFDWLRGHEREHGGIDAELKFLTRGSYDPLIEEKPDGRGGALRPGQPPQPTQPAPVVGFRTAVFQSRTTPGNEEANE